MLRRVFIGFIVAWTLTISHTTSAQEKSDQYSKFDQYSQKYFFVPYESLGLIELERAAHDLQIRVPLVGLEESPGKLKFLDIFVGSSHRCPPEYAPDSAYLLENEWEFSSRLSITLAYIIKEASDQKRGVLIRRALVDGNPNSLIIVDDGGIDSRIHELKQIRTQPGILDEITSILRKSNRRFDETFRKIERRLRDLEKDVSELKK